jgi:hypothetical protein
MASASVVRAANRKPGRRASPRMASPSLDDRLHAASALHVGPRHSAAILDHEIDHQIRR